MSHGSPYTSGAPGNELSIDGGILLKSDWVWIPPELYNQALVDLHKCNPGTEKYNSSPMQPPIGLAKKPT